MPGRVLRSRCGVINTALVLFEMCLEAVFFVQIGLERRRVLADVMPAADKLTPPRKFQARSETFRETGDVQQVDFQPFPGIRVTISNGVCIDAVRHDHSRSSIQQISPLFNRSTPDTSYRTVPESPHARDTDPVNNGDGRQRCRGGTVSPTPARPRGCGDTVAFAQELAVRSLGPV